MKCIFLLAAVVVLATSLPSQASVAPASALCQKPSIACQRLSPFAGMVASAAQQVQAIHTSLRILQQRKTLVVSTRHSGSSRVSLAQSMHAELALLVKRRLLCTLNFRSRGRDRMGSVLKTSTTLTHHRTASQYGARTHPHPPTHPHLPTHPHTHTHTPTHTHTGSDHYPSSSPYSVMTT